MSTPDQTVAPKALEATIKQFQEAVTATAWDVHYGEFCHRLGRAKPDKWTEEKWHQFKELSRTLKQFDAGTLARILTPEPSTWTAEEILRQEG